MFLSVKDLIERNVQLQKAGEKAIKLADDAKAKIVSEREAITARWTGKDNADLPKATRQQMIARDVRKATQAILAKYQTDSKAMLKDVGKLAGEINAAAELYSPIKRLSWVTMQDPKLGEKRSLYTSNLKGAGFSELQTMLDVFESTGDLAGLAALASEVNARDDASLRKAMPNARIVKNVKFGDEEQLAAIFHSGRHMTDVVVENEREVTATANGAYRNTTDRVRQGLRSQEAGASQGDEGGAA